MNQKEANEKVLELMNKYDDLSEKEIQLFKELMFQCDLKIQDKYEFTPLMYALQYNKTKKLNISEEQIDYLIKNSGLTQQNYIGYTALIIVLIYNKNQKLNISEKQIDYIIQNSDLKQQDNMGMTSLMYALKNNKSENLNINEKQFDYLIKNSDLKKQKNGGYTPLMYALCFNQSQNLKLTKKQFKEIYEALNKEQKQKTFKQFIQTNIENNHDYIEEVNLLLYNLQFKPDKKTIYWLKKNNYQDIVQMIEKRDLFFQLNQDFKEIDNHQKIAIIKI